MLIERDASSASNCTFPEFLNCNKLFNLLYFLSIHKKPGSLVLQNEFLSGRVIL